MTFRTDHLVIGTGPSALAAAMALRRWGVPFEVADVGFDLEPERESRAEDLARQEPGIWSQEDRDALFPPPTASIQILPGSNSSDPLNTYELTGKATASESQGAASFQR
jgi:hypothetical protein